MKLKLRLLGFALAALLLGGGEVAAQGTAVPVAGSKFLQPTDLDPVLLLPPPPLDDALPAVEGRAELARLATHRSAERLAQARHDDEVEDVTAFAGVIGPNFDLKRLPATATLFADLRREDSLAAKRAKAYFKRERPYVYDRSLNVCDDGSDVRNSYPSGHATMGYAAAAVLANLIPTKAQPLLLRAADYAESRLYCGVHYRSDVQASQVLANVLVVRLMAVPAFQAELEAARQELIAARIAP